MHHEKVSFKRDYLAEDWDRAERRERQEKKKHFVKNEYEYDPEYDKTPRRSAKTTFVHKCVSCGVRNEGPTMSLPRDWVNTKAGIQCPECADSEIEQILEVDRIEV
jgi:DNA-directed RNA polymerase subunit RPC12/RpoP